MLEFLKEKISDREFAIKVYANLCNIIWYDYINNKLIKYTWRSAARFVAELRNSGETYINFYCSGGEGVISEEIEKIFNENGIVAFKHENNLDKFSMRDEEIIHYLKKTNPIVISWNRNNNIESIIN